MTVAIIESLDHEGRGVAHVDGKVVFVEGALPGERVECESYRRKPSFEQARLTAILDASSQRVTPGCPHFGVCGGCSMQHFGLAGQVAAKQRVLEDAFWHIGRMKPETAFPPIIGEGWGYRHRARLSIRHVAKKGGVLVGFHERNSRYVAVMDSCAVLPPQVSRLLPELKRLFAGMSSPDRLPQVEVAVTERTVVLLLRHLDPLGEADRAALRVFADTFGVVWYLQSKGPETVRCYYPAEAGEPFYDLPDFGLRLTFAPNEFTQVNPGVNRMLVRRAMALLKPCAGERVADLFCGLGNFSLPIASLGADVLGIEGSAALVARAKSNAEFNGLAARSHFAVANLFDVTEDNFASIAPGLGECDKFLIDPPRDGAQALVAALPTDGPLRRIVYVSCNPATLARDAAILVNDKGFRLTGAGIACMFPHTSHVESIALFER